eukprot:TRINITY_DN7094_c0_g1_i2.p1 TRINITY_DN7094_c0_g1~~TRINITY_DN7094_c0_g1_i2.p1  ORF type:complete len:155 (+),score=31.00 TRINITY_DN7094_c0_g1_i2:385-849(+)
MSPKKRYEVQAFTTCVSEVMNDANCNVVIDMGAGKGYLSRFLGFSLDFDVVAIDCSRTNTEGAQKQTNKISSTLSKIKKGKQEEGEVSVPEEKEHKIIHIESWIDASTDHGCWKRIPLTISWLLSRLRCRRYRLLTNEHGGGPKANKQDFFYAL